ncbi:MAG TPA: hypothetical protein VGQ06_08060 [Gemmatimonadales bacterium]|nr:hypothetical protein [Gemmatimonadales bacterium]
MTVGRLAGVVRLGWLPLLAMCGGSDATTGALAITINGLPAGASGDVAVTGPNGYTHHSTATETLTTLSPGRYTISASAVTRSTVGYAPTPTSQMATVMAGGTASATVAYAAVASSRSGVDRLDDVTGPQVHVVYVLPSDGDDRHLDTDGTLEHTVGSWQTWLGGQTGGRVFRLDTYQGALDITFVQLARSNATMMSYGAYVRDTIEKDLTALGLVVSPKIYAVYYDGGSTFSCGGGAWPPALPGRVGALYLHGTPPGAPPCNTNTFVASPSDPPKYLEFSMIHELMHTLGFVATGAPHFTLAGHVSDSPTDLMYAGSLPWAPSVLDVGQDDYYNPGGLPSGVLNFSTSLYLTP